MATEFVFASCPTCQKEVLTHVVDFADDGSEIRRCVHCDGELSSDWHTASTDELPRLGYAVVGPSGCGGSGCGTRRCG